MKSDINDHRWLSPPAILLIVIGAVLIVVSVLSADPSGRLGLILRGLPLLWVAFILGLLLWRGAKKGPGPLALALLIVTSLTAIFVAYDGRFWPVLAVTLAISIGLIVYLKVRTYWGSGDDE